ncbi:MAG: hypothetical protein WKF57_17235 [Nakamurella sp.]
MHRTLPTRWPGIDERSKTLTWNSSRLPSLPGDDDDDPLARYENEGGRLGVPTGVDIEVYGTDVDAPIGEPGNVGRVGEVEVFGRRDLTVNAMGCDPAS